MSKFLQGKFNPKHPEKYVGDPKNIQIRSSYELRAMMWLDDNPAVIKWGSEEFHIPYVKPTDGKIHRYFPDIVFQYKAADGSIRKVLVEIKPEVQTRPPKLATTKTGKASRRYLNEAMTYATNMAKWEAAQSWCKKNGFEWMIWDEYALGIKTRK